MPAAVDIFFASHDGQTRRIVERIGALLQERGLAVGRIELGTGVADAAARTDGITLLAAPIRYGRPLPVADRFVRQNARCRDADRFALLLVSLSARRPGRTTAAGNLALRKWLKRRQIRPAIAVAVAGRLDYPRYAWYDRLMIRLIMMISGGPTDPALTVEYTDWRQVEAIAGDIAALAFAARLQPSLPTSIS